MDRWCEEQLGKPVYRRGARPLSGRLVRHLSLLALIPQVRVLNYFRDMPSRVDFLLVKDSERHIVEIDDPSHYAIMELLALLTKELRLLEDLPF